MNDTTSGPPTAPRFHHSPVQAKLRGGVALLAVLSLGLVTAAAAPAPASATTTLTQRQFVGNAYGTAVSVGSVFSSGASAPIFFGCSANTNIHRTNTTAGLSKAPVATTGTISTQGDTYPSPARSRTSASTAKVNLLGGLVRASAVTAVSSTTVNGTGFTTSSAGTSLANLFVAGIPVSATAAPNTRKNIAGFGYVVINEQSRTANGLSVNGLHLVVTTKNVLGVSVGTNVVISRAVSGLSGPVFAVNGGEAYGSRVNVANTVKSGETFLANMPCLGTGGAVRGNTGVGVRLGTALQSGTISNTVQGSRTNTSAMSRTTSTVQSVNVLNGLVKATGITSAAQVSRSGGSYALSTTGTKFATLSVAGHPAVKANAAPNTRVDIAGVGTLYLNRVVRTSSSVQVVAVELVLTKPAGGLVAGTTVKVAHARASLS